MSQMSRLCEISGKKPQFGNNVSHANNKTRRVFRPNIQKVSFQCQTLGKKVTLKVSTSGLRTIDKYGGFEAFLVQTPARRLNAELSAMKTQLEKAGSQ